jgi:DNA-binding transcriptional LysR family regulator
VDIKWLEDVLVLYDEQNFSRAAERRNITQPAFSRRIRLFENWLGAKICDRSVQPIRLIPELERLIPDITNVVADFYHLRNSICTESDTRNVTFATQHALVSGVFPELFDSIRVQIRPVTVRLRTANYPECLEWLEKGQVNFVLCYQTPAAVQEDRGPFSQLLIGKERLVPVTATDTDGNRLHEPCESKTIKMMNYPPDSFLRGVFNQGRMMDIMRDYTIENVCTSSLATAQKQLMLAGMGIAWLPETLVHNELDDGRVESLEEHFGSIDLSIVLLKSRIRSNELVNSVWKMIDKSFSL